MTLNEAIEKREELLAEERKLNQARKILQSESIPQCAGITMAIGQYNRRLAEITEEIKELADSVKPEPKEEPKTERNIDDDVQFLLNLLKKAKVNTKVIDNGDEIIKIFTALFEKE
jgi:hypothetical protein